MSPVYSSESYNDELCSLSLVTEGWQPIGVDQPPGTGHNYPFVLPQNNEERVVGDLFLRYNDPNCRFELPFKVAWLFGFGCGPSYIDEEINDIGIEQLLIQDNQNQVVFDTRTAAYTRKPWGPRAWVIEWNHTELLEDIPEHMVDVLRIVFYMLNPEGDSEGFPKFVRLSNGMLDGRALSRVAAKLTTLVVPGLGVSSIGEGGRSSGILAAGHNTELEVTSEPVVDGGRRVTTINIAMEPGLGAGRYVVDCDEITSWGIKRINNIDPTSYQNFDITAEENACARIQRPWQQTLADSWACRSAKIQNCALQIDSDCEPCCTCNDFVSVYESVRNLSTILADYVARAHAVRDWLADSVLRMDQQRECRAQHKLRAYAQSECSDKVACSIAYCNSTEDCVQNVLIPISFQYADTITPDIKATTRYSGRVDGQAGQPAEICGFTKRAGNVSDNYTYQLAVPYVLGGAYPHYWVFFDAIEPYSMGFVTFFVEFPSSRRGNTAAFAVDAYSLPSPPLVSPVEATLPHITDYGYVIGSGPTSPEAACVEWRLVPHPVLAGAAILQEPCCVDDLSDFVD